MNVFERKEVGQESYKNASFELTVKGGQCYLSGLRFA
ncbi:hypothetical protein Xmir_03810 [Xenorhabdus miraniensis]|uniref:Uncharacterized protein n=1 Tax=Xenorhabdus miraniensis TaxID=351674 RepID=A0A2D0JKL3_9GAMM|nr:hypothetical protein Xmir_03810 [Xenorhabdus miraniensis]